MACFATDRAVPKEILRMRNIDLGAAWDMQVCAQRRDAKTKQKRDSLIRK